MRYNKDAEANDMVHMGSDHRCVMATFTITTLGKSCHYKTIKGKHDIIKHECPNRKSIEVEKLEFEKRYPEIIDFFLKKKKTPPQKKAAAQAESEDGEAQATNENAAAAEAKSENTEAEAEVERMCTGTMMMTAWRLQEMHVEDILDIQDFTQ